MAYYQPINYKTGNLIYFDVWSKNAVKTPRLKDYYLNKNSEPNGADVFYAFSEVFSKGLKEIVLTEKELFYFVQIYKENIPADTNIASGYFTFWGFKIKKLK